MERTKEEWQAIGKVLAHGIYPGCYVKDHMNDCGTVGPICEWEVNNACDFVRDMSHDPHLSLLARNNGFAMVIDPPTSLSGKEVSVTIDGQTYTAIIK